MQRSITYKNYLAPLYAAFYIIYSSIGTIYPFLPPLLALLFVLYSRAMKEGDSLVLLLIVVCLIVFEANYGYLLFSSIIYFYILYKFIIPKVTQNILCVSCLNIAYVLLTYIGYFLFLTLIAHIFLLQPPEINFYILYYMVIDFFLVSLL